MASDSDRSIAGISLPQWMKNRITDRYDLENAFSPPTDDDGFFFIPYPKTLPSSAEGEPKVVSARQFKPISQTFEFQDSPKQQQTLKSIQNIEACQPYLPQAKTAPREVSIRKNVDPLQEKVKSTGADDGFKSDEAACGYSVVAVAQQILSKESSGDCDRLPCPPRERTRRNSKSLPASPHTSPKLLRKNPYFTNIFFGSSESVDNDKSVTSRHSRLVSAAIESQRSSAEDLSGSTLSLKSPLPTSPPPLTSSIDLVSKPPPPRAFKAKPSELREMNFWSPTSM